MHIGVLEILIWSLNFARRGGDSFSNLEMKMIDLSGTCPNMNKSWKSCFSQQKMDYEFFDLSPSFAFGKTIRFWRAESFSNQIQEVANTDN